MGGRHLDFASSDAMVSLRVTFDGDEPADALAGLAEVAAWLDRLTARAVVDARDAGVSWRQIAERLGVSPQTAINRYRDRGLGGEVQPSLFD